MTQTDLRASETLLGVIATLWGRGACVETLIPSVCFIMFQVRKEASKGQECLSDALTSKRERGAALNAALFR